jgi:hypothetical protein
MSGERLFIVSFACFQACAPPPTEPRVATQAPREPQPLERFERAAHDAGLEIVRCRGGWSLLLVTPGTREATAEETHEFLDRHRQTDDGFFRAGVDASGLGHCWCEVRPGICADLEVWEDSPTLLNLPGSVAHAAKEEIADTRINVSVLLIPVPKPRCSPRDTDCGPVPYDGVGNTRSQPRPPGRRRAIKVDNKPYDADGAKCTHDGECKDACGCASWKDRARFCDLLYRPRLKGAWCGCVDGACSWFR